MDVFAVKFYSVFFLQTIHRFSIGFKSSELYIILEHTLFSYHCLLETFAKAAMLFCNEVINLSDCEFIVPGVVSNGHNPLLVIQHQNIFLQLLITNLEKSTEKLKSIKTTVNDYDSTILEKNTIHILQKLRTAP